MDNIAIIESNIQVYTRNKIWGLSSYWKISHMIVLKSDYFSSHERLTHFINENHIKREDILVITQDHLGMFTMFFYGDDSVEEITHGIFS